MRTQHNKRLGIILFTLLAGASWHAQAAMSTEQAVQALLGKHPAVNPSVWPLMEKGTGRITPPAAPSLGSDDGSRRSMVVPRGATLAVLLAPVLRQVQAPKEVVFKTFVALNPQAFVRGDPNRLMAGATVHLFSDADVAQLNGAPAPSSAEARRGWVRFP